MPSTIEGFQVVDTCPRIREAQGVEQVTRQVDHEERQTYRVVYRNLFDTHEIFQTKVLLGIAKGKLDLEAQRIIVDQAQGRKRQVAAEQNHMPHLLGCQICSDNNHDVDQFRKVLMQTRHLIH